MRNVLQTLAKRKPVRNPYFSYLVKVSYNVDDPLMISMGCILTSRGSKLASDTVPKKARAQKGIMRQSDMIKEGGEKRKDYQLAVLTKINE